jgi:hypothetical protein
MSAHQNGYACEEKKHSLDKSAILLSPYQQYRHISDIVAVGYASV